MDKDEFEDLRRRLEGLTGARRARLDCFLSRFEEKDGGSGIDVVLERLRRGGRSRSVVLLHLVLTGVYPGEQVFRQASTMVEELGWGGGFDWILSCTEEAGTTVEFASDGIAYDVSNTLISPVLTGIQRVVWEVGRRLRERKRNVYFFAVKKGVGPVLLSPEHVSGFLNKYESSGRLDLAAEDAFEVYGALGLSSRAGFQPKRPPLRVLLRARLRKAYEFSDNYLFPPAFSRRIQRWLKRWAEWQREREEAAAMPKGEASGRSAKGRSGSGGRGSVVWFDDCDLLVAELFCPFRTDFYPAFLSLFEGSTMVIHDVIPISHPHYCVGSIVGAHVGYLRVSGMFGRVVPVSRSTGERYAAFMKAAFDAAPRVDPLYLPNFMEVEWGDLPPPTPDPEVVRICCFSTMEPRKNHWRVIEACEQLWEEGAEFELVLIGGYGWKSEELVNRIEFLRKKGRPILKSRRFLDDNEVALVMRTCVCSVYPSEVEGFGLPVVESLALGVPVITSNLGSMAEIAEVTEGCVLVDPFSLDSIRDALARFVGTEADRPARRTVNLDGLHSLDHYIDEVSRRVAS